MAELLLPGIGLVVCAVLLLRLALGAPRRRRLDAWFERGWARLRRVALERRHRRQRRAVEVAAAREADAVIRRVKREVEREGNVIRPSAFRPREHDDRAGEPPRKPH
ncbi:MAG TPA: hypothetical protein VNV16_00395 [Methylibium sp.]|nr:hypothetical protein [Methylibium sp.]